MTSFASTSQIELDRIDERHELESSMISLAETLIASLSEIAFAIRNLEEAVSAGIRFQTDVTVNLQRELQEIKAEMISHNDFQEATYTLRTRPERTAFG
jgi:L-rhamnose isomerase